MELSTALGCQDMERSIAHRARFDSIMGHGAQKDQEKGLFYFHITVRWIYGGSGGARGQSPDFNASNTEKTICES